MMRSKFWFFWAILAVIAMAGLAPPARAAFELEYSVNGDTYTVVIGTGSGTVLDPYAATAAVGSVKITATGSGTTTQPFSSLDLTVGGSEAGHTTIQVYVT